MLPCCIECPFHAIQAVHLENRIVLAGTIQAQIFGHHGRGDSTILRGGIIDYRFAAEIASPNAGTTEMCLSAITFRFADHLGISSKGAKAAQHLPDQRV